MTRHLVDRPDMILGAIEDHWTEYGYGPSVRYLVKATGLTSTSSVHHHLRCLRSEGKVTWADGIARSLRVVPASAS